MKSERANCEFRTCCKRSQCPCDLWHETSNYRDILVELCELDSGLLPWEIERLDAMYNSGVLSQVDKDLLNRLYVRLM